MVFVFTWPDVNTILHFFNNRFIVQILMKYQNF